MIKTAIAGAKADKATKPVKEKKILTPKEKKKRTILYSLGVFLALAGYVVCWGTQPVQGTIHIGICRTFAELQLRYPNTMLMTGTEQFGRAFRIYYIYTGAFGETRSDMMECKFMTDAKTGALILENVELNRLPVDKQKVAAFNKTIPAVIAAKPDLVLPYSVDDLLSLKKN